MQIVKFLTFAVLIALMQTRSCDDGNPSPDKLSVEKNRPVLVGTPKPNDYRIATSDCFIKESCLAFVSVSASLRNVKSLIDLSDYFSKKNPTKTDLVVYFFDDYETASAFAKGRIPPRDLDYYAIGVYRTDEKEEYLKVPVTSQEPFKPAEKRPDWRFVFKSERAFKEDRVNEPSH